MNPSKMHVPFIEVTIGSTENIENNVDEPLEHVISQTPPQFIADRPAGRSRPLLWAAQRFTLAWVGLDIAIGTCALVFAYADPTGSKAWVSTIQLWVLLWFICSSVVGWRCALGSFPSRRTMITVMGVSFRSVVTSLAVCMVVTNTFGFAQQQSELIVLVLALSLASLLAKILLVRGTAPKLLTVAPENYKFPARHRADESLVYHKVSPALAAEPERLVTSIIAHARSADASAVEIRSNVGLSARHFRTLSWELRKQHASLRFTMDGGPLHSRRVHCAVRDGHPVFEISAPDQPSAVRIAKRTTDMVVASCLIVAFSPLLAILALGIRRSSRGPALYKQIRVGLNGRPFTILKFRSMTEGSDASLDELLKLQNKSENPLFKVDNDPRVTPLGAILRRYSLDELPQLFNVLQGSMSLVGPRPQRPAEVALYRGDATHRLGVRPGMTGLWQVSGRSNLSWEEAEQLDIDYAYNWSLLGDLQILARTLPAVISGAGAY